MNWSPETGPQAWWKRVLLSCCALLMMVASIPAQAVFPADLVLFRPEPYLEQVERSGFYQDYPELAFELIEAGGELTLPGAAQFIKTLFPPERYTGVLRFILPEAWVRAQVEQAVTDFWAYYNFRAADLRIAIDFRPVKTRLQGAEGQALVKAAFEELPECSAQDLINMAGLLLQGRTDEFPRCRPPQQIEQPVYRGLQLALEGFTSALPDELALAERHSLPGQRGPGGLYALFRYGLRWSIFFLALLAAWAIILLGYSWRRFLEWAGPPLYAGGVMGAVLASLLGVAARWLAESIGGILPATARQVFGLFSGMALGVFQQFLAWMGVAGVVFAVAGLGVILASRIMGKRYFATTYFLRD